MMIRDYKFLLEQLRNVRERMDYCYTKNVIYSSELVILEFEKELQDIQTKNKQLVAAVEGLLKTNDTPVPNCLCHLSPPCNDCVEYGGRRKAVAFAKSLL